MTLYKPNCADVPLTIYSSLTHDLSVSKWQTFDELYAVITGRQQVNCGAKSRCSRCGTSSQLVKPAFHRMNGRVFSSEHYLVNVDVAMNMSFCWICRRTQHCSIDRFHPLQSNTGV